MATPPVLSKEIRLELAIKAKSDNSDLPLSQLAYTYDVPCSTLKHRWNGRRSQKAYGESKQRLTTLEERNIMRWLDQLIDWGWPASIAQLMKMATHICQRRNDWKPLHDRWYSDFLTRYPEFKTKWSRALDQSRKDASDLETIQHWFEIYTATCEKYGIAMSDRWNMDEKGFALGVIDSKKIVVRANDYKRFRIQPGNREWTSLIECVSVDGRKLPAYIIFAGKTIQAAWGRAYNEKNAYIRVSENGWTDNEISVQWLNDHFEPSTRPCHSASYRLLIIDGHGSHVHNEFVEFCWEKKIVPLCLPPHTTHILQPLDVGVFLPLSQAYKARLYDYCSYGVVNVGKQDFLRLFEPAREEAMTASTVQRGWEKSGLQPYNPNLILDTFKRPTTPPESCTNPTEPTTIGRINQIATNIMNGVHTSEEIEELRDCALSAVTRRDISEKQNSDILEKQRNRRRQRTTKKGIKAKVLTVQEIQEISTEIAAKQAEEEAAREAALAVTEANKFARAVWEALPIRDALIKALRN